MKERFTLNGKLYKTVEAKNWEEHCEKCAFLLNNECEIFDDIPRCEATERADGKNVYFLEVKTNFDQITENPRALAEFLADIAFGKGCDDCPADNGKCDVKSCHDTWLEWLNKEVEK